MTKTIVDLHNEQIQSELLDRVNIQYRKVLDLIIEGMKEGENSEISRNFHFNIVVRLAADYIARLAKYSDRTELKCMAVFMQAVEAALQHKKEIENGTRDRNTRNFMEIR